MGYNAWQFVTVSEQRLDEEQYQQGAAEVDKILYTLQSTGVRAGRQRIASNNVLVPSRLIKYLIACALIKH